VETANRLMYVGRDPGDSTRYLDGALDDVAWFDRALNVTGADAGTVSTIISSGVAAIGAHADLVAHWDLDTTSGFTEADNVNGIVLTAYTATPLNDGPQFRPGLGQFDGALEFDGIDDFATFQDPTFDVGAAGTVNMWVKLNDLTSRNTFFEGSTNGMEFAYRESSSGQFFGSPTRVPSVNNLAIQNGNAGSLTDQWVNLQYTWNFNGGGGQEMHIFINGTEVSYLSTSFDSTLTLWASVLDTTTELMTMGRDGSSTGRNFGGLIDDVAWFNSELSTTQLNDIRTLGVTQTQITFGGGLSGSYVDATANGNGGNLIAYWDMNDAIGTTTVSGDGGTDITLNLQFDPLPPPPAPVSGYGVFTDSTTNANVLNNVFFNDEIGGAFGFTYADSNQTLDPSNITGLTANPFFNGDQSGYSGTTLAEFYRLRFGSSAAYQSTEFEADIATAIPHIGANQENPIEIGTEDILVVGSDFDDLVMVTFTSDNDGFFTYTRNVTGVTPDYVGTFHFTDITSFTFDAYGGDDVFVVVQPTAAQGSLYSLVNGITFNGGLENNDGNALDSDGAGGGDTLVLLKSASDVAVVDSARYLLGSETAEGHTGTITIVDGVRSTVVTFTGTEPIRDELSVNERTFTYASTVGGGHETITVSTPGDTVAMMPALPYQPEITSRTLDNLITSTLGPSISFNYPHTLLDINAGVGDDTLNINSIHADYRAEMDLSGDGGFDTVNLNSILTLGDATVGNTGNLTVTAGTIHVTQNIDAIGTGVISLTADDGSITMDNGTTTTTDTGSITYSATGDVALSRLISTSGALYVTAGSGASLVGAITDNSVDEAANLVTTGTATLIAETGIGSAGGNADIDTTVAVLDVTNSTSGDIDLTEADAVTVIQLSQSGDGNASLRTVNGTIAVDNADAVPNAITFTGTGTLLLDANGVTADVLVNDGIQAVQGHVTLQADRDIVTTSAPLVTSGGNGSIVLQAVRDIQILDPGNMNPVDVSVAGTGAIRLSASTGVIVLGSQNPNTTPDATQHTVPNDVVLQTETGAVTNTLPLVYDIQAPQVNSLGQMFLTMKVGRPGEKNITVTVFWGDGTLTTETFTNSAAASSHVFVHQYFGNPDTLNPAAPILVNVQVAHDPLVVLTAQNVNTFVGSAPNLGVPAPPPVPAQNINADLSSAVYVGDARAAAAGPFSGADTKLFAAPGDFANPGLVEFQDTTVRATVVPIPGDGLASFPFDVTPPVDLLEIPEAAKIYDTLQQAGVQLSEGSTVRVAAVQADDSQLSERVLLLEILSPDGDVLQNIILPETVLDDMLEVISRLPDGKYRFQMREPGEDRLRLLLEFEVRQGKIVGDDEATDRPPSSKKKPGAIGDPPAVPEATPEGTPDATDSDESIMQVLPAHEMPLDSIVREPQEQWGGWLSGVARRAWRRAESAETFRSDRDDSSGEDSLTFREAPVQLSRAAQLFRKHSKNIES
jgi:Concanavalin A-like lectin/glucanases superfamily